MKKIFQIIKKFFKAKAYVLTVAFVVGILFGFILFYYEDSFQASLFNVKQNLEESDIPPLFMEYRYIRDISISSLSENQYLVEFFAAEGKGNSLHQYLYVITKKENIITEIRKVDSVPFINEDV